MTQKRFDPLAHYRGHDQRGLDHTQKPEDIPKNSKASGKKRFNVTVACVHCKAAHIACEEKRPCSRCVNTGKADSCVDAVPRKRGRPKLKDVMFSSNDTVTSPPAYDSGSCDGSTVSSMENKSPVPSPEKNSIGRTSSSSTNSSSIQRLRSENDPSAVMPMGPGPVVRPVFADLHAMTIFVELPSMRIRSVGGNNIFAGYHPEYLIRMCLYDLVHDLDKEKLMEMESMISRPTATSFRSSVPIHFRNKSEGFELYDVSYSFSTGSLHALTISPFVHPFLRQYQYSTYPGGMIQK
ncbi:hypothetical protein MP638_007018 [Amoeboaphelidium occidentale]|nr:hypothetical protein MP638_007018 [Amoeboaphelidium occidentale]